MPWATVFSATCAIISRMEPTDGALISAYQTGDEAAFATLVARHMRSVFNLALRLVADPAKAEDVAQETFVKAWKHLDRFDTTRAFRPWVLAITHTTAIDHLRKKRAFPFSLLAYKDTDGVETPFAESLPTEDPSPEDLAIINEASSRLQGALTQLPAKAQEVLFLHYNEGLTFDEIGIVLGEPLHTVKSRHRRALIALRAILG